MRPYYQDDACTIYHGDCREVLPALDLSGASVVIADPPYGETSLAWDVPVRDWLPLVEPVGNVWCFGSLRFFMEQAGEFAGWKRAQDIVWEKHNGSGFAADRFRRVHELVVQFYRGRWGDLYKEPVKVRSEEKTRTASNGVRPHTGAIQPGRYQTTDRHERLMRSVVKVPSCNGTAVHPTQKPVEILDPLLRYSCPPGGLVIDPFAGSGSALVAAKQSGRRAIGVELDEADCANAAERLSEPFERPSSRPNQGRLNFGGVA